MTASTIHAAPGRHCPLHYRYAPTVFAGPPDPGFEDCEVLYVVGGLYGNTFALARVLALFERERGRKHLVFNGDFHWFDVNPRQFQQVQSQVLAFDALRGNVETELADETADADAGCGCAYPEWVGEAVVHHSNRILQRLRHTAATDPALRPALARLPMWRRADVGGARVAIVHGDAESLAGWGFAQEHLSDPAHHQRVQGWFAQAQVDVFASSHTCLPVFQQFTPGPHGRSPIVLNNGAAGMPNFRGDGAGLLTRIAVRPFHGPERRFGLVGRGLFMDAIAIDFDTVQWQRAFAQQWPAGSDAQVSYGQRIHQGPDYTLAQALRPA
jgi:hypothetical protein